MSKPTDVNKALSIAILQMSVFCFVGLCVFTIEAAHAGQVFWTDFGNFAAGTIEQVNDDGTGRRLLVSSPGIFGLDIDVRANTLYWNNTSKQQIQRADLDGNNISTVVSSAPLVPSSTTHVALDTSNDKVYWSTQSGNRIRRANLDGTQVEDVLSGLSVVDGIDIDAVNGYVYWTEQLNPRIARARLDGSQIQTLVQIATPFGATDVLVDQANGLMYWNEPNANRIRRANLDGSNPETVITLAERPFGFALDGKGNIYWADLDGGRIRKATLAGTNISTLVSGLLTPRDVVYFVPEPSAMILSAAAVSLVVVCCRL